MARPPCRFRYAIGFRGCATFSPMALSGSETQGSPRRRGAAADRGRRARAWQPGVPGVAAALGGGADTGMAEPQPAIGQGLGGDCRHDPDMALYRKRPNPAAKTDAPEKTITWSETDTYATLKLRPGASHAGKPGSIPLRRRALRRLAAGQAIRIDSCVTGHARGGRVRTATNRPELYPTETVFRYPGNSRPANRIFADVGAATGARRKTRERDSGAPGGDPSRSAASRRGPSPDTRGPGGRAATGQNENCRTGVTGRGFSPRCGA